VSRVRAPSAAPNLKSTDLSVLLFLVDAFYILDTQFKKVV